MLTKKDIWHSLERFSDAMPGAQIDYSVHISTRHKYIYTIVPKAACSSMRLALARFEFDVTCDVDLSMEVIHGRDFTPTLRPAQVFDLAALARRADYFKFCIVRDPYTRLLSCYLNRIAGNKPQKVAVLAALGREQAPIDTTVTFKEFVAFVSGQTPYQMDPHWRTQYHQTMQDSFTYDFVGRFEKLSEGLTIIGQKLGPGFLSCVPTKAINSFHASDQFDDFYDRRLLDKVAEIFSIDFDTFGYAFR